MAIPRPDSCIACAAPLPPETQAWGDSTAGSVTCVACRPAGVAEIVLPRLNGRTIEQAQAQLERQGLLVEVEFQPNEAAEPGTVVGQRPIAGARVELGEQVVLEVSDGPLGVRVPELGEVEGPEAVRLLGAVGLRGETEAVFDETVPQNQVVATVPAVGARTPTGSTVRVLVSKGPAPRTVPDVIGETSADAFAAIGRAELQVGGVTFREAPDELPGTVLSTNPPAGEKTLRDQPVKVVVVAEPGASVAPDLVGFTRSNAAELASAGGWDLSVRTRTVSDRRIGRVIAQSPMANSPLEPGGTVTVTVGVAPAPTTTAAAPSTTSASDEDDDE